MPTDYPDWGGQYNDTLAMPSFDMAELAVRLGSFISYDRSGTLMWADDFEGGLSKWTTSTTGANSSVSLVTSPIETGNFAARLHAGTDANSNANINRILEIFPQDRMGLAVSARLNSAVRRFRMAIYHHTGTHLQWYEMRLNYASGLLQLRKDVAGFYDVAAGIPDLATKPRFSRFKFTVDLKNAIYDRVAFGSSEYASLNLTPYIEPSVSGPYFEIEIANQSEVASQSDVWVDNAYVTRLEPDRSTV